MYLAHLISEPVLIPEYSDRQWLYVLLFIVLAVAVFIFGAKTTYQNLKSNLKKEFLIVYSVVFLILCAFFGVLFIFSSEKDSTIINGRELKYTVKAENEIPTYYIYEWGSIPDGVDEPEIMEKDFIYRKSVWRSGSKEFADALFDGRTIRLNGKNLELKTVDGRKTALIDGSPAVLETIH